MKHSVTMKYDLKLENPKDFYHEAHRPGHFLQFSTMEDIVAETAGAERENVFE